MKKLYSLLLLLFASGMVNAQTLTIAGGTGSNYQAGAPMYTYVLAPRTVRVAYHYPASQLATMPVSSIINSIAFERAAATTAMVGNPTLKIYIENQPASSLDLGSGSLTWATILTTATKVYEGDPTTIVGNTPGWKTFPFGTGAGSSSTFSYTGGALVVYCDYIQTVAQATTLNWIFATPANGTPSPNGWTTNSTKYSNTTSGTTPSATLATSTGNHYHIQFNYTPGTPCVSPPTAGSATTDYASVCSGVAVTLNLSGNSAGTGQTYEWYSSTTETGTYTSLGLGINSGSNQTINPTSTLWYKAKVTCGAGFDFSMPIQVIVTPSLSGSFTLNPAAPLSATNFQTFGQFVSAFSCGVSGPVTLNVSPGTYNEQVIMGVLNGVNATNTVTINGNGATLTFSPSVSAERAVIKMNGTDYVTINDLNIVVGDGATYGYGIHMWNNADNNTINNCTINAKQDATGSTHAGIVVSGSETSATSTTTSLCDNNTFSNNTIIGGYYGIVMASSAATASGNQVTNNIIRDVYIYGIYNTGPDNTIISGNDVSRPTRTGISTFYGVYLATAKGALISGNKIHNTADGNPGLDFTAGGIYLSGADGTVALPNVVSNNFIYNFGGVGIQYGLYNSGSDYSYFYHNTVSMEAPFGPLVATYGFYQTTLATGVIVKNNIFSITRGGLGPKYGVYLNTATSTVTLDNNDYNVTSAGGNNTVGHNTTGDYATLAAWQAASSQDAASISIDPVFTDATNGNLQPKTDGLAGATGTGVTTDINASPRGATPDMGAIEYTVPACGTPITAGTTQTSVTSICGSGLLKLNLTGNTFGAGQTYTWQSSATIGGTYTDVTSASAAPSALLTHTAPVYYRAKLVCGAGTEFSAPVLVGSGTPVAGGSFTINPALPSGSGNFQSFNEAVNYIKCGISGAVTFNVAPGTYNEQVILRDIPGTSAANTITFQGNGAVLNHNATVAYEMATIKVDGVDHVTINNMTINALGDDAGLEYGIGVQLMNGADFTTISNCGINANTTATTTDFACISFTGLATSALSAGANPGDNNTIIGNTLTGGYYSMVLAAATATPMSNLQVLNNTVLDHYTYGIYVAGVSNGTIRGNNVSRPNRTSVSTFYGIALVTSALNTTVERNRIHNPFGSDMSNTGSAYGLYSTADATLGNENMSSNNLIYNFNGAGIQYGIYNSGAAYNRYYNNTISFENAASTSTSATYAIYQVTVAAGLEFRNNNIYVTRGGTGTKYGMYFSSTSSTFTASNNNYWIDGGGTNNFAYRNPTTYSVASGLAAWSGTYDNNAVNFNPGFLTPAAGDLQPGNNALNDLGFVNSLVLVDYFGNTRGAIPDIGAVEFTGFPLGAKLLQLAAARRGDDVLVTWSAATEEDMSRYIVERSNDGRSFTDAGSVTATGTTDLQQDYSFTDMRAAANAKGNMLYYRLRMLEVDGSYDYSKVVTVAISGSTGDIISVYPNPFTTQVVVNADLQQSGEATIILRDVTGKQLLMQRADMTVGANNVSLQGLDNIPSGVYELSITVNGNRYVQKLVK